MERSQTDLGPVVVLAAVLVAGWTFWAVGLYGAFERTFPDHQFLFGVLARSLFWGLPSALYLQRYWGARALEPLGLSFPLGSQQVIRSVAITLVLGASLILATATQKGVPVVVLIERLNPTNQVTWLAPVFEELVFRGVLVAELLNWTHDTSRDGVELRVKFWVGQLAVALVFLAVHWPFWVFHAGVREALLLSPPVFVTGLVLGLVFATTRSIWGCIVLHWLNNSLSQFT